MRREAPAAARNREPIAEALAEELPPAGLVLEVASGTGEHAVHLARRFPHLQWQPSDPDPAALESIAAWREHEGLANLLPPLEIDAAGALPQDPLGRGEQPRVRRMAQGARPAVRAADLGLARPDGAGPRVRANAPHRDAGQQPHAGLSQAGIENARRIAPAGACDPEGVGG